MTMRKIDLHAYPGTKEWIDCQGPYVEALAKYWKREWKAKPEADVVAEFKAAGVEPCLVALDLSTTIKTPPCSNDYVASLRDRHKCVGARSSQLKERPRSRKRAMRCAI